MSLNLKKFYKKHFLEFSGNQVPNAKIWILGVSLESSSVSVKLSIEILWEKNQLLDWEEIEFE